MAQSREERLAKIRERRQNDPEFREKEKQARLKYRAAHPELVKERQAEHDAKRKEQRAEYYKQNKKKYAEWGKAYREANREYESTRTKEKSQRYLAQGWCHNCPTPRMENSNTYCEKHWYAQKATQRLGLGPHVIKRGQALKAKLETQNYTCPYTGVNLIPGVNASVDHVIPVSQRPDLKGEISNIEWVDLNLNHMKTDMSREQFLEVCLKVVEYTGIGKRIETK